jgi:hypothetical protein
MKNLKNTINMLDADSFVAELDLENINFKSDTAQMSDFIRYYSGDFFVFDGNRLDRPKMTPLFNIDHINGDVYRLRVDRDRFNETYLQNGLLTREYDSSAWKDYATNLIDSVRNQNFYDHSTDIKTLNRITEQSLIKPDSNSVINREFIYNFHAPEYEAMLADPMFSVSVLPTVYNILKNKDLSARDELENLTLRLGGLIPESVVDGLCRLENTVEAFKKYYTTYAKAVKNTDANIVLSEIKATSQNINNRIEYTNIIKSFEKYASPFPFYMKLTFSNFANSKDNIVHTFKNKNLIYNNLTDHLKNSENAEIKKYIVADSRASQYEINSYSLRDWLSLETYNNASPADALEFSRILEKLKKDISKNKRNYQEFTNKKANNEVLIYKIEKRLFNHESKILQTFWFDVTSDNLISFYDSQIKYGTEYFYTLKTYVLVYGNKYTYDTYYENEDLEMLRDIDSGYYKFTVSNSIDYRVLEVTVSRFNGAVLDTPATKPEIDFAYESGKFYIHRKQSALEENEVFEPVELGDLEQLELIRKSQENIIPENIHSKILDGMVKLEIYKTVDRPTSYISFQGKKYKTLELTSDQRDILDMIVPNKKYYFMFRYLNAHDIASNPSKIYEVELRDDDGYRYLIKNEINIKKTMEKIKNKNFRRYLLIKPSQIQLIPRTEQPESISDVELGPDSEKVWNRGFVLQIRSKKSNRILRYTVKAKLNKKI